MSEPLQKKEDLIRYFASGAKPREQWRVGSEYEKVLVSVRDGRALPFSGPNGVEEIMRRLIDRYGYEANDENGRIISLKGERAPITIEPGGQIELSGEQCETIHCAHKEFTEHAQQLLEIGHQIGATVLGLGIQPVSRIDEIELLPKERYHIMYPYMARKGRLGQRMMKQTAGVQANLDFSDEADAIRKLRVSMGIPRSPMGRSMVITASAAISGQTPTPTDPACRLSFFAKTRASRTTPIMRWRCRCISSSATIITSTSRFRPASLFANIWSADGMGSARRSRTGRII
jgi:glutamate--cysteine ligase